MFQPTFLEKEAKFGLPSPNPQRIIRNMNDLKPVRGEVEGMKMLNHRELREEQYEKTKREGNGLVGDLLTGTLGYVTPKSWKVNEKAHNLMNGVKDTIRDLDTKAAGKVMDVTRMKDEGMAAKLMSTKETRTIAKADPKSNIPNLPKELVEEYRRASLLAPAQNTAKVMAPILGTVYVGEKLYPIEEQQEQLASLYDDATEKNGIQKELMIERLDKQAAMQKLAQLEEENEKLASELEEVKNEKELFWRESEKERMEKKAALQEKRQIEMEFLEKKAAYEEFRLRTTKRERVKESVKVAETLLEDGIIKQAEFDAKVDFLVDCDDETFNLYSSMSKQAQSVEKGLESSPFFIDYRSKDEESAHTRQKRGLSKRGQTIGEAARDLHR